MRGSNPRPPGCFTDEQVRFVIWWYAIDPRGRFLKRYGMLRSMSGKGNCYDNAVAESFFSSLKNEIVHHRDYHTRDQARSEIFEYIELFYNRQRIHQSLNYQTPMQYESVKLSTN